MPATIRSNPSRTVPRRRLTARTTPPLAARLPETKIVYISWAPTIARWSQAQREKKLNELVAEFINGQPRLQYIETYDLPLGADAKPRTDVFVSDKLHLNAAGYKLLTERVRPFVE